MVTVNKKIAANTGTATFELLGLSTDTKPTGTFSGYKVGENSVLMELDTGDIYYFDGGAWQKMSTDGQGGGSITVDDALDINSAHPVQNKVIAAALNERPVDFIITADFDVETEEITNASASLADVLAVADESRNIVFIMHAAAESGGTTKNVYERFTDSNIENYGGGNGEVLFSKIENDDGTPLLCRILAVSGDFDGAWRYDEIPLATATP